MTNNSDTDNFSFTPTEAAEKPTLLCVGTVGEIEEAHLSKSENYVVQPINLNALDAGRNIKLYFLYRPEWFTRGFNPATLKADQPGAHFVYGKNIANKDNLSNLRGLAGSNEAFVKLATILTSITSDPTGPSMEDVTEALVEFFEGNVDSEGQPKKIGFELRQQMTKTDEINEETGKNVYVRENRYEVKAFFDVTKKSLDGAVRRASNSDGKVKMTYSVGDPTPF